ncbi:RcpC/CpaB family pilus assembly protein [Actinoplanes sp. NPDC051851]|uniref:RcpC/CpaB family pilus assembly protein n=1 Tax=Actinoplanes sp. NPDC051851 TaxID=3154753 RepID=UPI0034148AEC
MRRRILILLAALLLAGISGVAVHAYASSADRRALESKSGVWVLVAKQRIPANTSGAEIKREGLTERLLVPAETVPEGTMTTWDDDLNKLRLVTTLQPKQLMMRTLFQPAPAAPKHTERIPVPKKSLAVSVLLSVAPQVAGNITAGDEVAVYYTYKVKLANADKDEIPMTRLILPRAKVITIGEAERLLTEAPEPTALPSVTATPGSTPMVGAAAEQALASASAVETQETERYLVTLAVDDTDSLRLIHAVQSGDLYLALLGPNATPSTGPAVDTSWVVR